MRKYWEMTKSQIQIDSAYSAWHWSSAISSVLELLILYAFWNAVYENRTTISDMPLDMMITYVVIALLLSNYSAGVGDQLARSVRNGDVAIELLRPYDLLNKLIALDLGSKLSSTVRDALPILILAFIVWGIDLPLTWEAGVCFLISAAIGVLIGTQLDMIMGILAFWLEYIWGLRILRNAVLLFFTGALVPIPLFPDWLQTLSTYLPFQSMIYVPVAIYTGQLSGSDAYFSMMIQMFWLVSVFALIRVLWVFALRRVTIFGG